MISTLLLSSCSKKIDNRSSAKILRIGFIADSFGLNEPTFSKKVYDSLTELNLSKKFKIIFKEGGLKKDYYTNIEELSKSCDIIICGYLMNDEVIKVSAEFPDKYFILLDGIASDDNNKPVYRDNIISIIFNENEKAYLAGKAISTSLKNSESAGLICVGDKNDVNVRFIIDSFKKGVNEYNKNIEIKYRFIKDPNDSAVAINLFNELEAEKCKIVYLCNGGYVNSAIDNINSPPPYIICEEIGDLTSEKCVLGVIEKDYKAALEKVLTEAEENKLKGGVKIFGLTDKAISLKMNEAK
jgi:basic membrane lipoprotein Med (substrate-binding protein (PBP1-ABC) superfamily)